MTYKKTIFFTAFIVGKLWAITMSIVVSVILSFITGSPLKPNILIVISIGSIAGILNLHVLGSTLILLLLTISSILLSTLTYGPITTGHDISHLLNYASQTLFAASTVLPLTNILSGLSVKESGLSLIHI